MPNFKKGSAEAKKFMAKLRAQRRSIGGWTKGQTRMIEVSEAPKRNKKNVRVKRKKDGVFKEFRVLPKVSQLALMGLSGKRENRSDKGRLLGITGTPKFYDKDAVREIELYAENDGDLYRQQRRPILINLSKKYKKGVYNISKSAKLWRYFIDSVMKKYHKDFGSRGNKWSDLLKTSDRQILAEKWAQETKDEFDLGNFTEQ